MSCTDINKTSEEIRNIIMNGGPFWKLSPEDTFDDIASRYDWMNENMILPVGEDQKYLLSGIQLAQRVSNIKAKKEFERKHGPAESARQSKLPDNIKKKEAGIRIHQIMAEIIDAKYNNKGTLEEVRNRAALGDYSINKDMFKVLYNLALDIIREVEKQQDKINKEENYPDGPKKAKIYVEQKLADPSQNLGGAADVAVLFSNKRISTYDFKTLHSYGDIYDKGVLIGDLMTLDKEEAYSLNMSEYVRIQNEVLGASNPYKVRLIPIHIRLKQKAKDQRSISNNLSTEFELIQAGTIFKNKYLSPIPLTGETSEDPGIDKVIDRQWSALKTIQNKLAKKGVSAEERSSLKKKATIYRNSIKSLLVDGEIEDIIKSSELIIRELTDKLYEDKLIEGEPNPKYLSHRELQDLISELSIYQDIIANTHNYYGDLKESNPEGYKKLKDKIYTMSGKVLETLSEATIEREKRTYDLYDSADKDANGKPLPLEELPFFTKSFTRFSDIDHAPFKASWKLLQDSFYDIRKEVEKMSENIHEKEKGVFAWAKANNMNRLDALGTIVNRDTGRLISKYSKDLWTKIDEAYAMINPEDAYEALSKIYEIRDIEEYRKRYQKRLQKEIETWKYKFEEGENDIEFKKHISSWVRSNDLENSKAAWANKYNNGKLKLKDDVEKTNYSSEYKILLTRKPLLDYYDMYVKYNRQFRDILGLSAYGELPDNFIANIRKSMVDHISMDNLNVIAAGKEFFQSWAIREEDTFVSDYDENGDIKKTIPMLFTTPFRNKAGDVDNSQKSYDLSKSLLLFGKMAFNYEYMNKIEPQIDQIKRMVANPSNMTPGTEVRNSKGQLMKTKLKEIATKRGLETDTYKLLEELTNAYLYGTKFRDNIIQNQKVDTTKVLLKLKQYYGKSTLAFAFIPGAAAFLAGSASTIFEGKKGISYTSKQLWQASRHVASDWKKYKGVSLFYHTYSEDPTANLIDKISANFFSKWLTNRTLMFPLRKTDENINDIVLNSMALNWGIDIDGILGKKGALIRLNRKDVKTTGIRSIWDLTTVDKTTNKVTVEGINKENFIEFRNAVKGTSNNIIGSLSQEDLSRMDTNLTLNIMSQFRSWMPGIVRERTGNLIYDDKLQAARWGRFKAAASEFKLTSYDIETGIKMQKFISTIVLPNTGRIVLDLLTFGVAPKYGLGIGKFGFGEDNTYIDEDGKKRRVRTNMKRAQRLYKAFVLDNPKLKGRMTFEQFLEVKEGQMKAGITELRAIILFLMIIHFLGAGGGDDGKEPPYMANWFSRFMYKNFTKAQSELTFMWSVPQFAKLMYNPVPMAGLIKRTLSTGLNAFDETRDFMFGEDSLNDQTPFPYFTLQWIYGGGQVARFIELFEQYKKSPYTSNLTGY